MKDVIILGRHVQLQECDKTQRKGISIGDALMYKFYNGQFHGMPLLFLEPNGKFASPRNLSITACNLTSRFNLPVVFLLPSCPAYERQRLIDRDVYFVVSDKFVHLPMLLANERIRKTKQAIVLSPVAQYLLLYHLQVGSIEGRAARDIEGQIPYSYESITLGFSCLEDLGLCKKLADGPKRKVIHFEKKGWNLWKQAEPFLVNPVAERVFCDGLLSNDHFPACGINALAHYTRLNPDPERFIMMSIKQLRDFKQSRILVNPNRYDGDIVIEAWKYPPVGKMGEQFPWVDKLSLAVSLREDTDPRVEGEVEHLINNLIWKD